MNAEAYLGTYHDMWAWQDDWSRQWTKVRKYVSGCSGDPWDARKPIINGLISEDKKKYNWSTDAFTVDTYWTIQTLAIVRAYCGKGSPNEINDAIWLAHRYGQILNLDNKKTGAKTMQEYCTAFLGQDCNGFVGNYFGLDPNTSVRQYALSRRKTLSEIQVNDLCVWYRSWKGSKKFGHIGVINRIDNRSESEFRFQLIHWGTKASSRNRIESVKLHKDTKGEIGDKGSVKIKDSLYYEVQEDGNTTQVFICPPPGTPNPKA